MIGNGAGLTLCGAFFTDVVEPLLRRHVPDLRYAAARIGPGSEVLGYDTEISADHDYGPSVQLFLRDDAFPDTADAVMSLLNRELPEHFEGWPVRFPASTRPAAGSTRPGAAWSDHGVELYTVSAWCERFLQRRFDTAPTWQDWLSYPEQHFLIVTAGRVSRDDPGELSALREPLRYFPRDVWLYKLVGQWGRVAEERAFVGRAGSVGDEIGSAVIAARMVENLMRLALLVERRYAPYPKWLGTAFAELRCADNLSRIMEGVLAARNWQEREARLHDACCSVAQLQVAENVPGAAVPTTGALRSRPFHFVDTLVIGDRLRAAIGDEDLRNLGEIGAADQFLSSNFVRAVPEMTEAAFAALLNTRFGKAGRA